MAFGLLMRDKVGLEQEFPSLIPSFHYTFADSAKNNPDFGSCIPGRKSVELSLLCLISGCMAGFFELLGLLFSALAFPEALA